MKVNEALDKIRQEKRDTQLTKLLKTELIRITGLEKSQIITQHYNLGRERWLIQIDIKKLSLKETEDVLHDLQDYFNLPDLLIESANSERIQIEFRRYTVEGTLGHLLEEE
ncbi:hypothetical protein [Methanosphaera sp.]